jgi:hypothetical protein
VSTVRLHWNHTDCYSNDEEQKYEMVRNEVSVNNCEMPADEKIDY